MIKLRNIRLEREILFDGENYVINERDFGTIEAEHSVYKGMGQAGNYLTESTLGSRSISIIGYILAKNPLDMEEKRRALFQILNPLDWFELHVDGKKLVGKPEKTPSVSPKWKENNQFFMKFVLDGFCPEPCFMPAVPHKFTIAAWKPLFRFPLVFPKDKGVAMGIRTTSTIVRVPNDGDLPTGMVVEFRARGSVEEPSLLHLDSREEIRLHYTMAADEVIQIDSNYGQKTVISNMNGDIFQHFDQNSSFIQLFVGDNTFRYAAADNISNLECTLYFSPKYLGI